MRKQTQARELALQALYQRDLVAHRAVDELHAFCAERAPAEVAQLAMQLVEGCIAHQHSLDEVIRQTAENWELERMAVSDRNILRLGVYELLFRRETPPKVAINEAIELAKKYSTENSPTFVNGVLDRIYNTRVVLDLKPDPEARADLHLHSTASDGSVPPEELPALAAKAGLSAIALTDHDSLEGIAAAREAALGIGLVVVAGAEFTAYAPMPAGGEQVEMHIAGLFLDEGNATLSGRLAGLRAARVERIHLMVQKLQELGLGVESEGVLRRANGGSVGRLHVAQEMVERGCCRSIRDVFEQYISVGRPGYVPKQEMAPAETIELIRSAGGCSVLCHPGLLEGLECYLDGLVDEGLDALEVHYPRHSAEDEKRLLDLCNSYGLLVSGGSDFHGAPKPGISIGQETVSFVELCKLKDRAEART